MSREEAALRYRPEHKQRTRQRILTHAGRLFRRHGYEGVGIDAIMGAAKLTRGGFYGYFRSKAELFAAVLAGEHDFVERLRARRGTAPEALRQEGMEVVGGYLHPDNRERVGRGCMLASLSVDVARAPRAAKRAYGALVEELSRELARGVPGAGSRDPRMLASIALCVGGLVLARGVEDEEQSKAILAACRDRVERELS